MLRPKYFIIMCVALLAGAAIFFRDLTIVALLAIAYGVMAIIWVIEYKRDKKPESQLDQLYAAARRIRKRGKT